MTKKRFTILYGIDENPFEWDIMDNKKDALICQCNGKPICDLLNNLNDENEQLKSICKDHREHAIDFKADCVRLEKENEQLRKENSALQKKYKALKKDFEALL